MAECHENEDDGPRISRRNTLQGGAASIAGATLSGSLFAAEAAGTKSKDTEVKKQRNKRVVQIKVTSSDPDTDQGKLAKSTGDKFLPEFYVGDGQAFNVLPDSRSSTEESAIITTPLKVVRMDTGRCQLNIPPYSMSDFSGYSFERYKTPEDESENIIEVSVFDDHSEVKLSGGNSISVPIGGRKKARMETIPIIAKIYEEKNLENEIPGESGTVTRRFPVEENEVEVIPEITVKDHGTIPVFSSTTGVIFPKSMPNAGILLNEARRNDDVDIQSGDSDVVVLSEVGE